MGIGFEKVLSGADVPLKGRRMVQWLRSIVGGSTHIINEKILPI